ncbi:MAG: response regulator [Desulfobacterales bacterium]|nr:response regulator [Desulfobacterales bacterium]
MPIESNLSILLVDDNEAGRYVTSSKLKKAGYNVIEATTGSEALKLSLSKTDLIILDINLPDINGFELCELIKASPKTSYIPILLLTAYHLDDLSKARGLEGGADAYLTQPVDDMVLIATIKSLLRLKEAEAEVRMSALQWQTTFDAAGESIYLTNEDMIVIRCNQSTVDLIGIPISDIIGKHCFELINRTACPVHHDNIKKKEYAVTDIHLNDRIFQLSVSPILDENDNFKGAVHILYDITERKKMEEEIIRSKRIEATGILAGGIAHDFNNLLSIIIANIDLSKMYINNNPDVSEMLSHALKASHRASNLIRKFITLSPGGMPIKKAISAKELIINVINTSLKNSNLKCESFFSDELSTVKMDPGQISQALSNIIDNAKDSMPGVGTITIESNIISTDEIKDKFIVPTNKEKYLSIAIKDTGIGIPPENIDKIFDPYFSTKNTYSQKGLGLGLTLAYSIIKKHDGYIDIESTVGVGTTIKVYLPA